MKNQYKTKEQVNFSINGEILKSFNETTKKKAINKSALIEQLINNWIKENK